MDSASNYSPQSIPTPESFTPAPESFTPIESIATPKSLSPVETRIPDIPKITTEWPSSMATVSKNTTSTWGY